AISSTDEHERYSQSSRPLQRLRHPLPCVGSIRAKTAGEGRAIQGQHSDPASVRPERTFARLHFSPSRPVGSKPIKIHNQPAPFEPDGIRQSVPPVGIVHKTRQGICRSLFKAQPRTNNIRMQAVPCVFTTAGGKMADLDAGPEQAPLSIA